MASSKTPGWMEDSSNISSTICLSKRELFGLILLAHIRNQQSQNKDRCVGYDPNGSEPNDGFITDGTTRRLIEHKLIPQMSKETPLEAILSTYDKYAKRGTAYGEHRTLVVYANNETQGMIKVSSLSEKIHGVCPFDQVLLMNLISMRDNNITGIFLVTEHHPKLSRSEVCLEFSTGNATVPLCDITIV